MGLFDKRRMKFHPWANRSSEIATRYLSLKSDSSLTDQQIFTDIATKTLSKPGLDSVDTIAYVTESPTPRVFVYRLVVMEYFAIYPQTSRFRFASNSLDLPRIVNVACSAVGMADEDDTYVFTD
jgi:hypothetical protein